jgi:uncharacterized protein (DUF2141 family)
MMQHAKLLTLGAALALIAGIPGTSALAQNSAPSAAVLRVDLEGFRNNKGRAHCDLFNDSDPAAFPRKSKKLFKAGDAESVSNAHAEIDFNAIPPGQYALVCYHDENSNRKFDQNAFGMPLEGYCFSNNVKPTLSAPNFSQCAFEYKGGDQTISITMIY